MSPTLDITPARLRAFLRNIEKPAGEDACWMWRGATNGDGYASGNGEAGRGGIPVHRIAYQWLVGAIPDGQQLDHLCRNRACVNPHHLEPVSRGENTRRIRRYGPWELRRYCRNGHALVGANRRAWSNGKGQIEIRCYRCHDGVPETRHAS